MNNKIKTIAMDLGGESRTVAQLIDDNDKVIYNYVIPPELISDGSDISNEHIRDAMIYGMSVMRDKDRIPYSDFYKDQTLGRTSMHPARPHDLPPQSDRSAFSV
jgi:hypothetical protein